MRRRFAAMGKLATGERLVVGVMTGTSIDAIDAALVRIHGAALDMRASLVKQVSHSLGDLRQPLRDAAAQRPMSPGDLAHLAWEFGKQHADVVANLLEASAKPELICIHGQTIFH